MRPATIMLIGNKGQLGQSLHKLLPNAYIYNEDVTDQAKLVEAILTIEPKLIINTIAYNDIDKGEYSDTIMDINTHAVHDMARTANRVGAKFVTYSTDFAINPTSVYGNSKALAEYAVTAANPEHLVIRTSCVYTDTTGFPSKVMSQVDQGKTVRLPTNLYGHPTHADWLAQETLNAFYIGACGLITVHGQAELSRYEWAQSFVPLYQQQLIVPIYNTNDSLRPYRFV